MNDSLFHGMSKEELLDLYNQRQERRYWTSSQTQAHSQAKKRKANLTSRRAPIASNVSGQALSDVRTHVNVFKGKTFHVFESKAPSKKDLECLIVEYGGEFAQARTEGNMAIPVGGRLGHPNAQGYKRKDIAILKPEWILESIQRRGMVHLIRELILYADEDTKQGQFYNMTLADLDDEDGVPEPADDVTEDEDEDNIPSTPDLHHKKPHPPPPEDVDLGGVWTLRNVHAETRSGDVTETEPESEYGVLEDDDRDAKIEEAEELGEKISPAAAKPARPIGIVNERSIKEEDKLEELSLNTMEAAQDQLRAVETHQTESIKIEALSEPVIKMGETADANAYDQDLIFKHLCFYLDTVENAKANNLQASKVNKTAEKELLDISQAITANGGRINSDIHDTALTHVIQHMDDSKRYKQIHQVTRGPALRQIVTPEYITDSIAEGKLLDENAYRPR